MTVCKRQPEHTLNRKDAAKDLPDKPPPGTAGVQATPESSWVEGDERKPENDLPDKPPPGTAGLDSL
ncbi:hypothetical protein [Corallococcus terminator]|uniref:Uncharacterized protein n=1 Tax=Corallococcus terminator TaxID=2316733 RepID=A0A3A8JDC4_9BACT|nr:hypothetical protein [Corallococcus terminator]RKG93699.1 hypothetical protein D7V88_01835 [Corallococcus terminator]